MMYKISGPTIGPATTISLRTGESQQEGQTFAGVAKDQIISLGQDALLRQLPPAVANGIKGPQKLSNYFSDPIFSFVHDIATLLKIPQPALLLIELMLSPAQIGLDEHEKMGLTMIQYRRLGELNELLNEYKMLEDKKVTFSQKADRKKEIELRIGELVEESRKFRP